MQILHPFSQSNRTEQCTDQDQLWTTARFEHNCHELGTDSSNWTKQSIYEDQESTTAEI